MPGQRGAAAARSRGARLPVLAGVAVVLLLAGAGAAAYVVAFHQPAARRPSALPSRPISEASVGLVVTSGAGGPAGATLLQLIDSRAAPEFRPLNAAQGAAGSPQMPAALTGSSTSILISLATHTCL